MSAGVQLRSQKAPRARAAGGVVVLVGVLLVLTSLSSGCGPEEVVVVGDWPCAKAELVGAGGAGGESAQSPATQLPIEVPWSTGFEDGFCGYSAVRGFCYGDPGTSYEMATAQAHSGRRAAAFKVSTVEGEEESRCVREGILPNEAYYGAWYLVPEATVMQNWNLMHFQGWRNGSLKGLWDVSLDSDADGQLFLYVYDFLNRRMRMASAPLTVKAGSWFRIVFYLRRAADATGEIAVFQDDQELLRTPPNIVTDDSSWGQWYVGSLAGSLTPPAVTVYVDDVTIDSKP